MTTKLQTKLYPILTAETGLVTVANSKLYAYGDVRRYGALGDGVTDDTTAIRNAISCNKTITFPALDYYTGAHSTSFTAFDLSAKGDNLVLISLGARFITNTTGVLTLENYFFALSGNNHVRFQGTWTFTDNGGSFYPTLTIDKGAVGISIADNCTDISIDEVVANTCRRGVSCIATGAGTYGTSRNIRVGKITGVGTYYGFVLSENGDDSKVGMIYAKNCLRPFIIYGANNVEVDVVMEDNSSAHACLLKRYSRNTTNFRATIKSMTTRANARSILEIEHQNDDAAASRIENVQVDYEVKMSDSTASLTSPVALIRSFSAAGVENTGACPHTYASLRLRGTRGQFTSDTQTNFTSSTPGLIALELGVTSVVDANTRASFTPAYLTAYEGWTAYTPSWKTNTGADVTQGNAALNASYCRVGNMVTVKLNLTFGSTTTIAGTYWTFGLPYAPMTVTPFETGPAYLTHASSFSLAAVLTPASGASNVSLIAGGSGNFIGAAVPFAWAATDVIRFQITYQAASSW